MPRNCFETIEEHLDESKNYLNHFEALQEWQDLADAVDSLVNAMQALVDSLKSNKCSCERGKEG